MTNKTLTSLIIRLAGFALFIKIFDFFGAYFMSIFSLAQMAVVDKTGTMVSAFDKLYVSGTVLAFANLILSLFLIIKADWIASKLVRTESTIPIDLSINSIMRIVIATIGIVYCAKMIYGLPFLVDDVMTIGYRWGKFELLGDAVAGVVGYALKTAIGIIFILKSEKLAELALRKKKVK